MAGVISTSFLSMVRSLFWRVEEACQLLVLNLSTNVVDLGISLLFYLRTASRLAAYFSCLCFGMERISEWYI